MPNNNSRRTVGGDRVIIRLFVADHGKLSSEGWMTTISEQFKVTSDYLILLFNLYYVVLANSLKLIVATLSCFSQLNNHSR